MQTKYDDIIVGAGFFGLRIALELASRRRRVLVVESDNEIMKRASFTNQARVHGGYHYPRSLLTALRSRVNLPTFMAEYADCVDTAADRYYAIARQFSKVSATQFKLFCDRIQAPIAEAPASVTELFDDDMIEAVFAVEEFVFDSSKLSARLASELRDQRVELRLNTKAHLVSRSSDRLEIEVRSDLGEAETLTAQAIYNCTYAHLNQLNRASNLPIISLKHELAELALVQPPVELNGIGITVMCGPFFSLMPFPPRDLYSLTHVRYTPHTEWHEELESDDSYDRFDTQQATSSVRKMIADASRFVPSLRNATYVESLYEIKTILPKSESDDSRPILFRRDHGLPGYTCVMGGKLDNIYDVLKELEAA